MSTTKPKKIRPGYEPIPGYVLEEVIGRGGFGEVWRADAPGGLKKAVKFVFGTQDQTRAARELRSLERIKGVQHPFLLTLERFEAIDDQLVIVTELADCSLEDVVKRNRDRGSCGIPRDVLISHLHDAADALDYLHLRYQLQHLDIKPGNLLLVGGHVKVADFGLLKDLREVECSVVGGLTPIYAPPEVFDGRPSMHSDQYSLAVMYQELLTGTRPFSGRTIAQLATQHVHSAPNLDPLPAADRPVIARALEKKPERRFSNCTELVDALRASRNRGTKVAVSGVELPSEDSKVGAINAAGPVEDLPQLSTELKNQQSPTALHHALVIALGGTGAECLQVLRRRAADLHAACNLDLNSVLIDTDMSSIHSMRVGEVSDRVPKCRTIYTPLRSAHEYRQNGTDRLKSISRRWIYNVPRSGATEGMRPLGRLALVDHGATVTKEITAALEQLISGCGDAIPSIYVVGSLTGGTGSGMYIDVVHLLRHLLDEAGLVEAPILSILSTAALQGDPCHPLALLDAQAAMNEMRHFLQAGNGYPGDVGAGWPSTPAARTPLRELYLVAGSLSGNTQQSPVETISEYVWTDATGARELLDDARELDLSENGSIVPPSVRSVGVTPLRDAKPLERKVLAPAVVRDVLIDWLGLPSKARQIATGLTDRIMRRVGMTLESVTDETRELITDEHRASLEQALAELTSNQRNDPAALVDCLTPSIQSILDSGIYQPIVKGVSGGIVREFSTCLSDRRADATTIVESLKLIRERASHFVGDLRNQSPSASGLSEVDFAQQLIACRLLEQIGGNANAVQERMERFATTLAMTIVQASKLQSSGGNPWDEMPEGIRTQFDSVVNQLHDAAASRYLVRSLTLQGSNIDASSLIEELMETSVSLVTAVVNHSRVTCAFGDATTHSSDEHSESISSSSYSDSRTQTDVTQALKNNCASDEPLTIEDALVIAKPLLLDLGGLQRLLLIVGTEQERSRLEPRVRDLHEGSLTVAVVPGATPKLIHEAQQIELANILARMSVLNGGNEQVTNRLSSRTDIAW